MRGVSQEPGPFKRCIVVDDCSHWALYFDAPFLLRQPRAENPLSIYRASAVFGGFILAYAIPRLNSRLGSSELTFFAASIVS